MMERTGHQSLEGVRSYKQTSDVQHAALSDILNEARVHNTTSSYYPTPAPIDITPLPTDTNNTILSALQHVPSVSHLTASTSVPSAFTSILLLQRHRRRSGGRQFCTQTLTKTNSVVTCSLVRLSSGHQCFNLCLAQAQASQQHMATCMG